MNGVDAVDVDVEMFWSLIYLVEVRVCIRKGVVRCQFCVRFFCFFLFFKKSCSRKISLLTRLLISIPSIKNRSPQPLVINPY